MKQCKAIALIVNGNATMWSKYYVATRLPVNFLYSQIFGNSLPSVRFFHIRYLSKHSLAFIYLRKMWKYFVFICVFLQTSNAVLESDANTLVLLDNLAIRETHSIFFKSLQGKPLIVF